MKSKYVLLSLLLLSGYWAEAQTYKIKYKVYYSKGLSLDDLLGSGAKNDSNNLFSIALILDYTIITDGKYMLAEAKVDSSFGNMFPISYSANKLILDLNNKLAYFPEEDKVKRSRIYELTGKNSKDSCEEHPIKGKDPALKVTTCENLPASLAPAVQFKGLEGGIRFLVTPDFVVKLISYQLTNEKLDFEKIFSRFKGQTIMEEYAFLD